MAPKVLSTTLQLVTAIAASPGPNRCLGLHCPDSPYRWSSPSLNAIINSPAPPKPVRYILNTSVDPDHAGGNELLSQLPGDSKILGVTFPPVGVAPSATIVAHENVLARMSATTGKDKTAFPSGAWPTDSYRENTYKLSEFINGEGVQLFYEKAAHTDGDSIVYFRYSDVIVAGDILNTLGYPMIDLAKGGSIQGEIDALNRLLDMVIPVAPLIWHEGGTVFIPGRGRIGDQQELVDYRDMITIIRDRVQDGISRGKSLAQIQKEQPTAGYTERFGSMSGDWTTSQFVEAVYRSLVARRK
jgi:glyoxylase-like metal-dependent hydrolase (beta-lactamase superfamily II)